MTHFIVPAVLAMATLVSPVQAQQVAAPELTAQQNTALRCSVAFALVAEGQAKGDAKMAGYPALGERGREFFVRRSAQLMDETGLGRDHVAALLAGEIATLQAGGELAQVMPPCLLLLDASGL